MSQSRKPRRYESTRRRAGADLTRQKILAAARALFSRAGIDGVTMERIARRAGVAQPTVYAVFRSKAGILREIMRGAIFGARYRAAAARIEEAADPVAQLRLTATVARTIYESEAREIGLLRGASAFSPELKKLEREFEAMRFEMQRARIDRLARGGLLRPGLSVARARRLAWMYTSREVFRMLVVDGAWPVDEFEGWLAETLVAALVRYPGERGRAKRPTLSYRNTGGID
jgi:AcrR family transcriptional regulator